MKKIPSLIKNLKNFIERSSSLDVQSSILFANPDLQYRNLIIHKNFFSPINRGMSEADRQKVAIVTGSLSGIGYTTSLLLAREGFYTYASARNIDKSASLQSIASAEGLPLKLVQLDITDDSSVRDAVE
jgi:hypothetical protein